jgi:hypothetical protein
MKHVSWRLSSLPARKVRVGRQVGVCPHAIRVPWESSA